MMNNDDALRLNIPLSDKMQTSSSSLAVKRGRGRKRDDSLPYNRARDVQRAFRARRAAHLEALEERVLDLEEENRQLRKMLNLPTSERAPLGRGPTGRGKSLSNASRTSSKTSLVDSEFSATTTTTTTNEDMSSAGGASTSESSSPSSMSPALDMNGWPGWNQPRSHVDHGIHTIDPAEETHDLSYPPSPRIKHPLAPSPYSLSRSSLSSIHVDLPAAYAHDLSAPHSATEPYSKQPQPSSFHQLSLNDHTPEPLSAVSEQGMQQAHHDHGRAVYVNFSTPSTPFSPNATFHLGREGDGMDTGSAGSRVPPYLSASSSTVPKQETLESPLLTQQQQQPPHLGVPSGPDSYALGRKRSSTDSCVSREFSVGVPILPHISRHRQQPSAIRVPSPPSHFAPSHHPSPIHSHEASSYYSHSIPANTYPPM